MFPKHAVLFAEPAKWPSGIWRCGVYLVRRRPKRIVYGGLKRRSKMTRQRQHRRCRLVLRSRFHVNVVGPRNRRSWTGKPVMDSLAILEPLLRIGTRTSRWLLLLRAAARKFYGRRLHGRFVALPSPYQCLHCSSNRDERRGEPWLIEFKHAGLDFQKQESPSGHSLSAL